MAQNYTESDGVDYSLDAIESTRKDLIEHRNHALTLGEMRYAVLMSHVIAYLHKLAWYEENATAEPPKPPAPTRRAAPPSAGQGRPENSQASAFPPLPPLGNG